MHFLAIDVNGHLHLYFTSYGRRSLGIATSAPVVAASAPRLQRGLGCFARGQRYALQRYALKMSHLNLGLGLGLQMSVG